MKRVGIVGIGDLGIGLAANILKKGYPLTGFDLRRDRLESLASIGGEAGSSPREVAEKSDTVFVMVLNGDQVKAVVTGKDGLLEGMKSGATIIITATIKPSEVQWAFPCESRESPVP